MKLAILYYTVIDKDADGNTIVRGPATLAEVDEIGNVTGKIQIEQNTQRTVKPEEWVSGYGEWAGFGCCPLHRLTFVSFQHECPKCKELRDR